MKFWMAVFLVAPLLAQSTQPDSTPGGVDGRVTNSVTGDPVSGASVHLYPQFVRGGANNPLSATTQADGSFRIETVPPGTYFVIAEQSSFTVSIPFTSIHVASGQQVSNLSLQLKPLATISGKVVDENGNPVPDAQVTAYTIYDWRGHTQLRPGPNATTGKDGKYLLKKIIPGRYFLAADPAPAETSNRNETDEARTAGDELVRTFYPSALNLEGAAGLDISPAQNAADTVIRLQRAVTHRVLGKVEDLNADSTTVSAMLSLAPPGTLPMGGLSKTVKAGKDGSFLIDHVLPGSYTLWLTASVQSPGGIRLGRGQKLLARQNIDVSVEDVTGIVLSVLPPVSLSGKVILDSSGTQNLAGVRVAFLPGGEAMFGSHADANVNADGSFSLSGVEPGEYRVEVQGGPAGSYVQSIQYNRQDVTQSGIDLSEGGGGELDVVLRMGAAEVDGTVVVSGGDTGAPTGFAILVPEQVAADGSGTLLGQIASNGTFVIRNVPPGRYFAVAASRLTGVWRNANFLREIAREGASVDVQENGHAQVQAPLINDQDIQQTAARLGLSTE